MTSDVVGIKASGENVVREHMSAKRSVRFVMMDDSNSDGRKNDPTCPPRAS
jgi:hypothetical protein